MLKLFTVRQSSSVYIPLPLISSSLSNPVPPQGISVRTERRRERAEVREAEKVAEQIAKSKGQGRDASPGSPGRPGAYAVVGQLPPGAVLVTGRRGLATLEDVVDHTPLHHHSELLAVGFSPVQAEGVLRAR